MVEPESAYDLTYSRSERTKCFRFRSCINCSSTFYCNHEIHSAHHCQPAESRTRGTDVTDRHTFDIGPPPFDEKIWMQSKLYYSVLIKKRTIPQHKASYSSTKATPSNQRPQKHPSSRIIQHNRHEQTTHSPRHLRDSNQHLAIYSCRPVDQESSHHRPSPRLRPRHADHNHHLRGQPPFPDSE